MGEAKRKKLQQAANEARLMEMSRQVGSALRKLATATSDRLGVDCFVHAELGRRILQEHGVESRLVVGFAAWRVGQGDGDVISHTDKVKAFLPAGGEGFAYHAWLESYGYVVDFTTYQLVVKARSLDALDGGSTTVDWCPDMLVLPKDEIRSYKDVAQLDPGLAFYQEEPGLADRLTQSFEFDPVDLENLRLIMASPDVEVFGPERMR